MKKVKLIFSVLVIALVVLLGWQNWEVIFHTYDLKVNLGFFHREAPSVPNFALLAGFFTVGLLLALFLMLPGRLKSRKLSKDLAQQLKLQKEKTEALERQLQTSRAEVTPVAPVPAADETATPESPSGVENS